MRLRGQIDFEDGSPPQNLGDYELVGVKRDEFGGDGPSRLQLDLIQQVHRRVFPGIDHAINPGRVRMNFNAFSDRGGSGAPSEDFRLITEEEDMQQIRQGDILLRKVAETSVGKEDLADGLAVLGNGQRATQVEPEDGRLVLARGEKTGHVHTMDPEIAQLWEAFGELRLVVTEDAELTHDEHEALAVEPGVYEVRQQIDWRPGPQSVPRFDYD